jgi:hypothetical protein
VAQSLFVLNGFLSQLAAMKKLLLLLPWLLALGLAQDPDMPLDQDSYHYLDRIDVLGLADTVVPTALKPYGRTETGRILAKVVFSGKVSSDWAKRMRILVDDQFANTQAGPGYLNTFFTNSRDVFSSQSKDLDLFINPIVGLGYGRERFEVGSTSDAWTLGRNSRGLRLRGTAFGQVGFLTEVYDNIVRVPYHVITRYNERDNLEGETFIKTFGSNPNALDFFHARAYLTWGQTSKLRIKFGYDRVHWGHGYQSLFLSDHAANHLMLQARLRLWKFEYISHFGQFIDFIPNKPDNLGAFPRKYGGFHMLTFRPNRSLSLSFFESVIFAPRIPGSNRGFELSYLVPIIFYRSIEQSLGSPDNGSLGFMWKLNVLKKGQFYGQMLLDDFNFSQFRNEPTFWGNKYGWQAGIKVMDVLPRLDLQAEYNRIRPYTYQHFNQRSTYTHYGQHLGHEFGANLVDRSLIIRYRPVAPIQLFLRYSDIEQGRDGTDELNYGSDPTRVQSVDRPGDLAPQGQGYATNIRLLQARASYQLGHTPCFVDAEAIYRDDETHNSLQAILGLRIYLNP